MRTYRIRESVQAPALILAVNVGGLLEFGQGRKGPGVRVIGVQSQRFEGFAGQARIGFDRQCDGFNQQPTQIDFRAVNVIRKIVILQIDKHFRARCGHMVDALRQEDPINGFVYVLRDGFKRHHRGLYNARAQMPKRPDAAAQRGYAQRRLHGLNGLDIEDFCQFSTGLCVGHDLNGTPRCREAVNAHNRVDNGGVGSAHCTLSNSIMPPVMVSAGCLAMAASWRSRYSAMARTCGPWASAKILRAKTLSRAARSLRSIASDNAASRPKKTLPIF